MNEFLFWIIFFSVIYALSWQTYHTWKRYLTPKKKKSKIYGERLDVNEKNGSKKIILEKENQSSSSNQKSNKNNKDIKDINNPHSIVDIVSGKKE